MFSTVHEYISAVIAQNNTILYVFPLHLVHPFCLHQNVMAQVSYLLHLLSSLFSLRAGGQSAALKIVPYHKSVLDWLVSASGGRIDAQLGHASIGHACLGEITAARQESSNTAKGSKASKEDNCNGSSTGLLAYALRYGVAHLHAAGLVPELEELLLDFAYFWAATFASRFCFI